MTQRHFFSPADLFPFAQIVEKLNAASTNHSDKSTACTMDALSLLAQPWRQTPEDCDSAGFHSDAYMLTTATHKEQITVKATSTRSHSTCNEAPWCKYTRRAPQFSGIPPSGSLLITTMCNTTATLPTNPAEYELLVAPEAPSGLIPT